MIAVGYGECTSGQRESSDPHVLEAIVAIVVARDKCVVLVELIVEPETRIGHAPRHNERLTELLYVERRVEYGRVDDGVVVDVAVKDIEEERGFLGDKRAAETGVDRAVLRIRLVGDKRVSSVEALIVVGAEYGAVVFVDPRPRQYLYSAKANSVVFRRERILVNADFSNRFLGRHIAAGEPVYVKLPSVGSR